MNIKILFIAIASISIASCSTAYRSGQTPDDVYYSPVRAIEERDNVRETRDERRNDYYRIDNYEEREIRMSTRDRRWRDLNNYYDYNYSYNPYMYGYNYGYYYNPYYYNRPVFLPGYVIVNPKNNTPRMTNLGSYNNSTLQVANNNKGQTKWVQSGRTYNNSNNSGSFMRRIITPAISSPTQGYNNRNSGMERNDTRTYNPSSNSNNSSRSSSPSSGSSGGGGAVSRPTRGN